MSLVPSQTVDLNCKTPSQAASSKLSVSLQDPGSLSSAAAASSHDVQSGSTHHCQVNPQSSNTETVIKRNNRQHHLKPLVHPLISMSDMIPHFPFALMTTFWRVDSWNQGVVTFYESRLHISPPPISSLKSWFDCDCLALFVGGDLILHKWEILLTFLYGVQSSLIQCQRLEVLKITQTFVFYGSFSCFSSLHNVPENSLMSSPFRTCIWYV